MNEILGCLPNGFRLLPSTSKDRPALPYRAVQLNTELHNATTSLDLQSDFFQTLDDSFFRVSICLPYASPEQERQVHRQSKARLEREKCYSHAGLP